MSKLARWVPPQCEWCGREFEESDEMERHRCPNAGGAEMGIDAPFEQTTKNYRTGRILHLHTGRDLDRPFPWLRGELDGLGPSKWWRGKK